MRASLFVPMLVLLVLGSERAAASERVTSVSDRPDLALQEPGALPAADLASRLPASLNAPAGLDIDHLPLNAALEELVRRTDLPLVYSPSLLNDARVSCACESVPAATALDLMLAGTPYRYVLEDNQILIAGPAFRAGGSSAAGDANGIARLARGSSGPADERDPAAARLTLESREGTVTGRVVEEQTLRAIAGAQVSIAEASIGALTNAEGRFLLVNVPDGTVTVRAQMIGFTTAEQVVTVVPGESVTVDFALEEEALALDGIVVTGTAGQARRREIGNSIEQVNFEQSIVQTSSSLESLLQGRTPGMNVTLSSGQVGDGGRIRLRGNVSAALSNDPLIYVDGVRVRSEQYRTLNPVNLGQQYGTFATPTPLQDINPADIARIEVIKGAAATTLYGTEAASGVIQIFTKRGTGTPVWEAAIDQGVAVKNFHGVARTLRGTPVDRFDMYRSQSGGTADFLYLDPWMQNAYRQKYSTSVRGAVGDLSYYVSGTYQNDEDIFVTGFEEMYGFRGNLGVQLTPTLNVDWSTSYNGREIKNIGCGDNNLCARSSYGIQDWTKASLDSLVYVPDRRTEIARLITGTTVRYEPVQGLSNRFTFGYDRADNTGRIVIPYGYRQRPGGYVSLNGNLEEIVSLELASTYSLELLDGFGADLSVGGQRISTESRQYSGWGQDFPGPGEVTINSGATSLAREERQRVITGGAFGQAVFKLMDRYFLTTGVRVDGSSAFGKEFGWQVYPKLSGSYVVSDEPIWPDWLGDVKLRAAWGMAGRAPGAFDAARTWDPVPWGGQTSFLPRNLGNPDLGPEKTTEVELGLDAAFAEGRVDVVFTWYRQITSEALVTVSTAPSLGPWGSQIENIGKLENRGIELAVTGTVLERGQLSWDLGVDVSTNHSKVLDMGGSVETASIALGHPVPSVRGTKILNPDEIADPEVILDHRFGPNLPTLIVAPRTNLMLPGGIQLSARGEFQGGHFVNDSATQWAMIQGSLEQPACFDAYALLDEGRPDELTAKERLWCTREHFDRNAFVYPADFFKIREVSVRVPVDFLVPWASSATLGLSAQNIYRWVNKDFLAYDPDQAGGFSPNSLVTSLWQFPAPPKYFSASLRVGF